MPPPSHVDLSVLWVPIMPETSGMDSAMADAAKGAKDVFEQNTKDIGAPIDDSLEKTGHKVRDRFKDWGQSITDTFRKSGKDSADDFNDELERGTKTRTKEIGESLGETFSDAGSRSGGKFADQFSSRLTGVDKAIDKLGGDIGSKIGNALGGVDNLAKKVGIDIGGWSGPLQDAANKGSGIKGTVEGLSGLFSSMPGKIGAIAAALGELAAPLAAAVAGGKALADQFDKLPAVHDRFFNPDGSYRNPIDQWVSQHGGPIGRFFDPSHPGMPSPTLPPSQSALGTAGDSNYKPPDNLGGAAVGLPPGTGDYGAPLVPNYPDTVGGAGSTLPGPPTPPNSVSVGPMPQRPGTGSFYSDWYPTPPEPEEDSDIGAGSGNRGRSSGGARVPSSSVIGGVSSRADLHRAGGNIANLYALANALQGTPYSQALRNDCSGMVSQLASAALGLPTPAAGQRFNTTNEGEWLFSHGFQPGIGPPGSLRIGWNPQAGNLGHTAATLPGGEHAESGGSHGNFLVGPGAAGADDPYFTMHAWLPMNGNAGPLGGGSGSGPRGSQHDPLYVTQTAAPGGSPAQNQGQQLGQGMVDGMLQAVGLDGSVFKGFGGSSNPLQFGITKIATGLLNWGAGMMQHGGGGSLAAGLGGGGGGIPGLGMIPGLGDMGRGGIPIGPGGAQNVPGGDTTINHNYFGDVQPFNVTQNGVQGGGVPDWKEQYNAQSSRSAPLTTPNAGNLPSGGGL